jgi:hypothetical protein
MVMRRCSHLQKKALKSAQSQLATVISANTDSDIVSYYLSTTHDPYIINSCAHVNERRPPLRWDTTLPQFFDGIIKCVRN